jgi:hypothetical protein
MGIEDDARFHGEAEVFLRLFLVDAGHLNSRWENRASVDRMMEKLYL